MRAVLRKRFSVLATGVVSLSLALVLPLQSASGAYDESIRAAFHQGDSTVSNETSSFTKIWEQELQTLPVRLKIPKLKVNATIQYVGLTSSGAMDVPKGRADVAWYKFGPRPGEIGSAVIDGHSGRKPGPAAVFDNLPKLRKGDLLYVEDGKKKSVSFVVREVLTYEPNVRAPEVFSSATGRHLNLITCIWSKSAKAFTKRLVVFADIKN